MLNVAKKAYLNDEEKRDRTVITAERATAGKEKKQCWPKERKYSTNYFV